MKRKVLARCLSVTMIIGVAACGTKAPPARRRVKAERGGPPLFDLIKPLTRARVNRKYAPPEKAGGVRRTEARSLFLNRPASCIMGKNGRRSLRDADL